MHDTGSISEGEPGSFLSPKFGSFSPHLSENGMFLRSHKLIKPLGSITGDSKAILYCICIPQ